MVLFQVSKLLDILKRQVGKAHQILKRERTPFEEFSSESNSDAGTSSQIKFKALSSEEDSPWEVSSDSETELSAYCRWQSKTGYVQASRKPSSTVTAGLPSQQVADEKSQRLTELQQ